MFTEICVDCQYSSPTEKHRSGIKRIVNKTEQSINTITFAALINNKI